VKILALDLATKTGFAHSCGASGTWDFKVFPDESGGMRLLRFAAKLREIHATLGIDLIAWEAVTAAQGPRANHETVKVGTELQAIVKVFAEERDAVQCMSVNLATIKAHALGELAVVDRNKDRMLASARQRWPDVTIEDDNQADALWLLDYVKARLALNDDLARLGIV
jgi:ATP-dependent exoDNAse (exonuclease V) alpha subunit